VRVVRSFLLRVPLGLVLALDLLLVGCATFASSQGGECSGTSLGLIVAECKLRIERDCPRDQDIETCPAVKECDARVDAWEACK
jgi:hypothetical protein